MTVQQAKGKDLVDYLSVLGYQPSRVSKNNYWYLSPLREERIPSFKVNRRMNRWYDFGEGRGGNLVDFGLRYHGCDIAEFLAKLGDMAPAIGDRQVPVVRCFP